jgi:hypothetical protein
MINYGPLPGEGRAALPKPDGCPLSDPGVSVVVDSQMLAFPFDRRAVSTDRVRIECRGINTCTDVREEPSVRVDILGPDRDNLLEEHGRLSYETAVREGTGPDASNALSEMCNFCIQNCLHSQ